MLRNASLIALCLMAASYLFPEALLPGKTPATVNMGTWYSPAPANQWSRIKLPESGQLLTWSQGGRVTYAGSDFIEVKNPADPGWHAVRARWVVGPRELETTGRVYVSAARSQVLGNDVHNEEWYREFFREAVGNATKPQDQFIALNAAIYRLVDHDAEPAGVETAREVLELRSGWCGDVSLAFATIARSMGYPARILNLENPAGDGHIVAEVMYDGRWHLFDPDYGTHYVNADNTVAGFYDLLALDGEPVRRHHDNDLHLFYAQDLVTINWLGDSANLELMVGQWPEVRTLLMSASEKVVLGLLFALSVGLTLWRPFLAPYLVVFGALFPLQFYMTSDIPVIAGSVIGLLVWKLRQRERFWLLLPTPGRLWPYVLFAGSIVLAAVAALAIFGTEDWKTIASDSFWFLARAGALVIIAYWASATRPGGIGSPIVLGTLVLALLRFAQQWQVPFAERLANTVPLLSDVRVATDFNVFAGLITLALGFAVRNLLKQTHRAAIIAQAAVVGLLLLSLSTTISRTGLLAGGLVLILFGAVSKGFRSRAVVTTLLACFMLFAWWNGALGAKPVITRAQSAPSVTQTAIDLQKSAESAGSAVQELIPAWRAALTHSGTAITQEIQLPPDLEEGQALRLFMKRGSGTAPYRVRVMMDNQPVYTFFDPTVLNTDVFQWEQISLPAGLLTGKSTVVVKVDVQGPVDSAANYIEVAGFNLAGPVYGSKWSNGRQLLDYDLSPDGGVQSGTYGVLLSGLELQGAGGQSAEGMREIDQSISERFVLWLTAVDIFKAYPLLGSGFYSFRLHVQDFLVRPLFVVYPNAHNMYLQVLADQGVLGFLALIAMFSTSLLYAYGFRKKVGQPDWAQIAGIVSIMLVSLSQTWTADLRYYIPALLVLAWAGVGVDHGQTGAEVEAAPFGVDK